MFGIAAIVVMLCSFDMEYDELLANLRRAGMWLPAVVGLWIIIYLFNTLSWYIIIRDVFVIANNVHWRIIIVIFIYTF